MGLNPHRSRPNKEKNHRAVADELLRISTRVTAALKSDKVIRTALSTTLAAHKARIFEKGLKEDGSKIGEYSEAYGKKKAALGKNPGFINFRLTDSMMNDYQIIQTKNNAGFGFRDSFNAQKAEWLQERFGDVFYINDSEMDLFTNVMFFELDKL